MIPRLLLAFVILCAALSPIATQTPSPQQPQKPTDQQDDVVKITTNLVQVDAVVTKDGKPVRDLTAEDFEIFEDGKKQEISSFAFISNVTDSNAQNVTGNNGLRPGPTATVNPNEPRRIIALVVDDLGLSLQSIKTVKTQLRKFIDQQVAPNDLVAIIRTSGNVGALQQFTNDRRLIDQALNQVNWNMCSRVGVDNMLALEAVSEASGCGYSRLVSIRKTLRTLRFIVDGMGEMPGRKSLIVFSDELPREEQDFTTTAPKKASNSVKDDSGNFDSDPGADNRSFYAQLQKIAERAIRSSVVIYAVDSSGLQYTGLTAKDAIGGAPREVTSKIISVQSDRNKQVTFNREGADLIAKETGGFLIRNSNDFQLDKILEDQSGYYLIGYRPLEETFNRQFHHIKARVKKSGYTLRTRFGFMGINDEATEKEKRSPRDKVTVALMSPFGAQDLQLDLTALFTNEESGSVVRTLASVNPKDLTFTTTADGNREATVQIRSILFGNNGTVVNQTTFDRKITLSPGTYERALNEGILFKFDVPVKQPGSYQLRVAASDVATNRVGSAGQFVEVPDLVNKSLAMSGIVVSNSGASGADDSTANSAVRKFAPGARLRFACGIFNASLDPTTHLPRVTLKLQLMHEGKQILGTTDMPIDAKNQEDLERLIATGSLRLDPSLESGTYFLQITVKDQLIKHKEAMQWVELEVVR
ncbi:MAG TPA: VWA domain-containing protein [Pyrinomonadaceae bacterium]